MMSRRVKMGVVVVVAVMLCGGLMRLRFDAEVLNLLPTDLGVVKGLLWHQRHFQQADELILTLRTTDPVRSAVAAEDLAGFLGRHREVTGRVLWRSPLNEDSTAAAELVAMAWLNQIPEAVTDLAGRLAPENREATLDSALETLASTLSPDALGRLAYDPYGLTLLPGAPMGEMRWGSADDPFASPDGRFRVLFVRPAGDLGPYTEAVAWLRLVQDLVTAWSRDHEIGSGLVIGYTGRPVFVSEVARGMERDLRLSVVGTTLMVCLLFWIAHRRWRPLVWLLWMLVLIMTGTLALGGWIWGELNVVSLGFAAILLGLSVDYALVLYQEAKELPRRSLVEVRLTLLPAIVWSAATTAGAFLVLNLGALPGLHQLGTLVAGGVLLAAAVILTASPPVPPVPDAEAAKSTLNRIGVGTRPVWWPTLVVLVLVGVALVFRFPRLDHTPGALVSERSPAQLTLQKLHSELNRGGEPLLVLVAGRDELEVSEGLRRAENLLDRALAEERISSYSLPQQLWPDPIRQQVNLELMREWIAQRQDLRQAVLRAGFTEEATTLLDAVLDVWARAAVTPGPQWPVGTAADWVLERCAVRTCDQRLALGQVRPPMTGSQSHAQDLLDLAQELELESPQLILSGWPLLGEAVLREVEQRLPWLIGLTVAVVLLCLYAAFGRVGEICLSLATLVLALLGLMAVMGLAGWQWNLMNLTAIPLLLGVGVDYTIHVQLALRRRSGDLAGMHRTVGRALLLCAATTITGFGSLGFAGNPGLASLGKVCATGIGCLALVALGLLPTWWRWMRTPGSCRSVQSVIEAPGAQSGAPSLVYHETIWRVGLFVARGLPPLLAESMGAAAALIYGLLHPRRRSVVVDNLLPVFGGDRVRARACAFRLFRQFGRKVAALLRHESGARMRYAPAEGSGWEHLDHALQRKRGVLLVALHLGDWEFGGALLARLGLPLVVLTQAEPGNGFTELRQAARRREGIDTVVVGSDPFAFVEVIRRLQEGAVVALLIDRPQKAGAVEVSLFDRPFRASVAAADLARATGCCLLPVYVVRTRAGGSAHLLPEIAYDRCELGNREARRQLTGEILRTFEPIILRYPDQWYHFIPIWPEASPQNR